MDKIFWILAIGCAGAYIAKKRKLNPLFWFFVCFMLGLTALIGLFFFPYLRRKIKKAPTSNPDTLKPKPTHYFPANTLWYYLDNEENQLGPFSLKKLEEMKEDGTLNNTTYIWNEAFDQWKMWDTVFFSETQPT